MQALIREFERDDWVYCTNFDTADPLLSINNPQIAHRRGRPQDSLKNRRQEEFESSTNRQPSQFERVEIETNEEVNSIIQRVIHRADTAPGLRPTGRHLGHEMVGHEAEAGHVVEAGSGAEGGRRSGK